MSLAASSPVLSVESVSKRFGGVQALRTVTFSVEPGEIHALIGPNGSGKTTLLNAISGIAPPDSGHVRLLGVDITAKSPQVVRRAGLVRTFQIVRLMPDASVIENVMLGCYANGATGALSNLLQMAWERRGRRKIVDHCMTALRSVQLEHRWSEKAGVLPLGHQRLLEIARCLVSDCRVILMDEPFSGLNPPEMDALMRQVEGLRAKGWSILLVEHEMRIVMSLADSITVLNYGSVLAEGTPSEIINNSEVIDSYLGTSAVERVSGRVER